MAHVLIPITSNNKRERYHLLAEQVLGLIEGESDFIANLANITALLSTTLNHHWTGFYLRKSDSLVLGPFQGPLACTRIALAPEPKGVCGAAAAQRKTLIVPDVDAFPGHIACSSLSRSEIVVPLVIRERTELVLDIDSAELNAFDEFDREGLEHIIEILKRRHFS